MLIRWRATSQTFSAPVRNPNTSAHEVGVPPSVKAASVSMCGS
ncbi:hypothetical protein [Asanoa ishikariensis]